ncbi:hypothetical protein JYQ62_07895 [Nostoc sp. UHCC 0702]|nr:hypothetical protein JYQ62_07895 [Nostoc sp. UHCC 0702]
MIFTLLAVPFRSQRSQFTLTGLTHRSRKNEPQATGSALLELPQQWQLLHEEHVDTKW